MQILALFFHMMKPAAHHRLLSLQCHVAGGLVPAVGRGRRTSALCKSRKIVKTIPLMLAPA